MRPQERDTLLRRINQCVQSGVCEPAREPCRQLLEANPNDCDALSFHAYITYLIGSLDEAEQTVRKLFTLRPGNADDHCMIARILSRKNQTNEALDQFDQAIKLNPSSPNPIIEKADLLIVLGRQDDAQRLIESKIAAGMNAPEFSLHLGTIQEQAGNYERAVEFAQRAAGAPAARPAINRQLYFLMGRALDKLSRYDDAFEAFQQGNACDALPFNQAGFAEHMDRIIKVFSKKNLKYMPNSSHASELPVFITSMPRSGSTLVEKIISAHSQAVGVDEINVINRIATNAHEHLKTQRPYPDCIDTITRKGLDQLGEIYLNEAEKLAGDHLRMADKTLQTWQHVGLVQLIMPGARVINVRRDPMDTCLSCFMASLNPQVHVFASNFNDLAFYYKQYDRLIKHWFNVASIELLEVQYEELVEDPERISREIIDFCGLEWEDECLQFHKQSDKIVLTLSYDQVRKPMYKTAVARWKKYEKHLGVLQAALAGKL
jgi:tetratricopeptide (TPR) repeat protein